jgi:hypothetical protein
MGFDIKNLVKAVSKGAPIIGSLIGGPAGGAAGTALALLARAFGADPENPEEILQTIKNDPEAYVKLRQIEAEHERELTALALKSKIADLDDRQSAREREIQITKSTGKKDYNLYVTAWCVLTGFFILTAVLMFYPLPEGSSQAVYMLFGALAGGFGTVLQYFFGSSKGSSDKTQMLAELEQQAKSISG